MESKEQDSKFWTMVMNDLKSDDYYTKAKPYEKPKTNWYHVILAFLFGNHMSNMQTNIYRKLK